MDDDGDLDMSEDLSAYRKPEYSGPAPTGHEPGSSGATGSDEPKPMEVDPVVDDGDVWTGVAVAVDDGAGVDAAEQATFPDTQSSWPSTRNSEQD